MPVSFRSNPFVARHDVLPFVQEFEEDALAWEEKLNRINALFDVWIDVQRRWVYLEGIFSGSADIKALLPMETSRFHSISTEFLTLMKKVSKFPLVMDVLNIAGVQRSLERLADLLGKIQKALGEYLERERSSFPRYLLDSSRFIVAVTHSGSKSSFVRRRAYYNPSLSKIEMFLLMSSADQLWMI